MESEKHSGLFQFLAGLALGLVPWGLGLIGVTVNLPLGAFILAIAFILLAWAFWIWTTDLKWHKLYRAATVVAALILYSTLIVPQIMNQLPSSHEIALTEQSPAPSAAEIAAEIQRAMPPTVVPKGALTPDDKPDPQITISPDAMRMIPPGALKIFLGANIGFMSDARSSSVVLRAAGRDLLTIHRDPSGILVDAQLFTADEYILADIIKNEFFINDRNVDYFFHRADVHSLLLRDRRGNDLFNIYYVNPSTVVVTGVFRYSTLEPLVVLQDRISIRGNVLSGNIIGDSPVLFGWE